MANTGQENVLFEIKQAVPYGDKIGHFFVYGMMTLFANYAFKFRYFANNKFNQYGAVVVIAFTTFEEFSQLLFSTRTFSLYDMIANLAGIGLFTIVSIYMGQQSKRYNHNLVTVK